MDMYVRRVPPRGTPRVPAPLPLSPLSPPDRDTRVWPTLGSHGTVSCHHKDGTSQVSALKVTNPVSDYIRPWIVIAFPLIFCEGHLNSWNLTLLIVLCSAHSTRPTEIMSTHLPLPKPGEDSKLLCSTRPGPTSLLAKAGGFWSRARG